MKQRALRFEGLQTRKKLEHLLISFASFFADCKKSQPCCLFTARYCKCCSPSVYVRLCPLTPALCSPWALPGHRAPQKCHRSPQPLPSPPLSALKHVLGLVQLHMCLGWCRPPRSANLPRPMFLKFPEGLKALFLSGLSLQQPASACVGQALQPVV